nr:putative nadp-dependent oxidoreductase yfmj [Quercus suber]
MPLSSSYKSIHLANRPKDHITADTFELRQNASPSADALGDGQVLYQPNYLSVDPAMRGWLNDTRSYIPPVKLGAVMRGNGVGTIIASKNPKFQEGEVVAAHSGWTEVAVLTEKEVEKLDLPSNGRMTDSLGVLGMTGMTAYFGIIDVGKVKAGDFVVVSGAAGATGSVVGQIAKLKGARVLGIAGSDDKCKWLVNELGFDDAINYKDPAFFKKFRGATKQLIDVFFDNVGGEILDLALSRAKEHSRFVICGGISQYNTKNAQGPKNYLMIISMRIRMEGFVVFDYESQYPQAKKDLARWLGEGKIKRQETIIKGGIEKMPEALKALYEGVNTGKLMVEVKPPGSDLRSSSPIYVAGDDLLLGTQNIPYLTSRPIKAFSADIRIPDLGESTTSAHGFLTSRPVNFPLAPDVRRAHSRFIYHGHDHVSAMSAAAHEQDYHCTPHFPNAPSKCFDSIPSSRDAC